MLRFAQHDSANGKVNRKNEIEFAFRVLSLKNNVGRRCGAIK